MKRALGLVGVGFAALLGMPRDARAFEFGTRASERPFRSAQDFAFELRFSPYRPQVDDESGLRAQPFAQNFGDKARFFIGAELDWQIFRIPHVGTIGPGFGLGYVSMSRTARTVSGRESGDETSLTIYPFWGVAVFRADVFWRQLGFPLVPYAKAGLAVAPWRASNAGGTSAEANVSGKGITWGTKLGVGLMFALDALDEGAARNMDNATGINGTYLFAEGYWLALNGLAQNNALHVGTTTWAAGIAFEF